MVSLRSLNTVSERPLADGDNGARDSNARQAFTAIESMAADGSDGIGDDCTLATHRQCVACRLDDGVAIVAGVKDRVSAFHDETHQVLTVIE